MSPRHWSAHLVAFALLSSSTFSARAQLQPGDRVAICGDSITEQKRYSVYMEDYLLMCQPAPQLEAFQIGWSGEKANGFLPRIPGEVLPFRPTVATTCYGMNDGRYQPIQAVVQEEYRRAMTDVVKALKAGGVRLIAVGSPGVVDSETFDLNANKTTKAAEYNRTLADLAGIAREVAAEQGVVYADVHGALADAMVRLKAKFGADYALARDGIHPEAGGHLVMAYAFLKALGCSGDIGTITVDLSANRATGSPGHEITACADGVVTVTSTKYPFCFSGDPANPDSTRSALAVLPFNEELNRYRLVVSKSPAPRMKVTWGNAVREFSAEQLAKGINLAAEFPDNPFSGPFAEVEKAIKAQQEFETPAVKGVLHSLKGWRTLLPDAPATLDGLREAVMTRDEALRRAASAAVKPVTHTIRLEPVR